MKDKNSKNTSVKETEKKPVKEEKIEAVKIQCRNCRYLDTRTIRDFHRDGIRSGLVEQRGKCTCEKVKARGHLVRIDMPKLCTGFVKGQFIVPEKKKVKKKTESVKVEVAKNDEGKTTPSEYHGPPLTDVERKELNKNKKKHSKKQRLKNGEKIIVKDTHNDDVKTFEQQGHRLVLVKQ